MDSPRVRKHVQIQAAYLISYQIKSFYEKKRVIERDAGNVLNSAQLKTKKSLHNQQLAYGNVCKTLNVKYE